MTEILERLENDECGIGYPVNVSRRMGYYYKQQYLELKAQAASQLDDTARSIASVRQRAADLLSRELSAHEAKRPGSMTAKSAAQVGTIARELAKIEKAGRPKGKERLPEKISPSGRSIPAQENETALERLAREEREHQAGSTPAAPIPG